MDVFCGIDWAEDHHDIALTDRDGELLARRRISDDDAGLSVLVGLLAEHGDRAADPVPVAIETPRGLLTACLRATGRNIYPINPMAVARYHPLGLSAGRRGGREKVSTSVQSPANAVEACLYWAGSSGCGRYPVLPDRVTVLLFLMFSPLKTAVAGGTFPRWGESRPLWWSAVRS